MDASNQPETLLDAMRYFSDPDLVPMKFDEAFVEGIRAKLPELPLAKSQRYRDQLGLSEEDAAAIHADIIRRFGRFPHRNRVLGRFTTPEEQAFLDAGGFAG